MDTVVLYGTEVLWTALMIFAGLAVFSFIAFLLGRRYEKRRESQTIIELRQELARRDSVDSQNGILRAIVKAVKLAVHNEPVRAD